MNVDDTLADDQFVAWDGSKPAVTDSASTTKITVINAHATVRLSDITFGGTSTQAQINEAIRELG